MAYRIYFSASRLLAKPSNAALNNAVALDFKSEAEALTTCRDFLAIGGMFPIALDYPDGTQLSGQDIKDRCFPRSTAKVSQPRPEKENRQKHAE